MRLIASWRERMPSAALPAELASLFDRLAALSPGLEAQETEDRIWELWTGHRDRERASQMDRAIAAVAGRQFEVAEARLTELIDEQPEWAEAWNKRATLYFLMERDDDSIADIARTLELEPRHFGAICGFAQICLRRGMKDAAVEALEAAAAIHPHLPGVVAALAHLRAASDHTVH